MRALGFREVRHTAECIAACRRGAMACERGRADPPLGSDETGLSFLFHESGIGADTVDLVRGWASRDELVGASADAVVLAPAKSTDLGWAEPLAHALGARRAAAAAGAAAGAAARREPVWLVREFAHTEFGYPHGTSYDPVRGAAQLRVAMRAGALPVAAYAPTR